MHRYAKANKKYMKYYDKNKELSYRKHWDVNNFDWAMSQKLPVNDIKWIKDISQFNEDFIKKYNEERDEGFFLEVDVQYYGKLHELHSHLKFLPERMSIEKFEKLVPNLHGKTENVKHIRNSKQILNDGLVFKKVDRVVRFNQTARLKPLI